MEVWAHRGSSHLITENTMDAFWGAVEAGVDGIELDVRLCGSGEPVVFHDATLWRLCRRPVSVRHTSLDQLQRYKLDSRRRTIPTLAEVLRTFAGKTRFILDLKGGQLSNSNLERAVKDVVLEHAGDCINKIILSSDSVAVLARAQSVFPEESPKTALILEKRWFNKKYAHHFLAFDAIHAEDRMITPTKIRRWKRMGMEVRPWTVNSIKRRDELKELGAIGIITDMPNRI